MPESRLSPRPPSLRTTLLWGDLVVAVSDLGPGESACCGASAKGWDVPEGLGIPAVPAAAVPGGWKLDATNATGTARLAGTESAIAPGERPILAAVGDAAVLRYPPLSLCFAIVQRPMPPPQRAPFEPLLAAGIGFAVASVLGGLALVFALTSGVPTSKPPALLGSSELSQAYYLDASSLTAHVDPSARAPGPARALPNPASSESPVLTAVLRQPQVRDSGRLSPLEINSVILEGYRRLRACTERVGTEPPVRSEVIQLELTIGPNGAVREVKLLESQVGDDVSQCVGDQLRRFEFPQAATTTKARIALTPKT